MWHWVMLVIVNMRIVVYCTVNDTVACCFEYSLEQKMCTPQQLKIVPNKCMIYPHF